MHPPAQAPPFRAVDSANSGWWYNRLQLRLPFGRTRSTAKAIRPNTTLLSCGFRSKMPVSIRRECWRFWRARDWGYRDTYEWRTRSGCTFCFFQQKIEWVRLMEQHPEYFEEAKRYEKNAVEHGSPFTWSQGESLDDLSKPDRVAQIRADHLSRLERARAKHHPNPLRPRYGAYRR